jgi:hypothetical protein
MLNELKWVKIKKLKNSMQTLVYLLNHFILIGK